VIGSAGTAVGYAQGGGTIVVVGDADVRAGLNQSGGALVLLGQVGALAGERQSGGVLCSFPDRTGPYAGRGNRGGRSVALPPPETDREAWNALANALAGTASWIPRELLAGLGKGARWPDGW
jgi:hypothetical protein